MFVSHKLYMEERENIGYQKQSTPCTLKLLPLNYAWSFWTNYVVTLPSKIIENMLWKCLLVTHRIHDTWTPAYIRTYIHIYPHTDNFIISQNVYRLQGAIYRKLHLILIKGIYLNLSSLEMQIRIMHIKVY